MFLVCFPIIISTTRGSSVSIIKLQKYWDLGAHFLIGCFKFYIITFNSSINQVLVNYYNIILLT